MWAAMRSLPLRQRSTHIPAAGSATRTEAEAAIADMLQADPVFRAAVADFKRMDIMQAADRAQSSGDTPGVGGQVLREQDVAEAVTANRLVPRDEEDMARHIRAAQKAQHPAQESSLLCDPTSAYWPRVAAELEATVRHGIEHRHDAVTEFEERAKRIRRHAEALEPLSRQIRQRFSPQHILCTPFEHAHCALFAAIVEAIPDLKDSSIAQRLALGAPVAGDLPPTHAWDEGEVPRKLGLDFDDLPHDQWNEWLECDIAVRAAKAKVSGDTKTAAVWEKTIVELDKGLCDGPWSKQDLDAMFGVGCYRAMRRFGVEQNDDIRACDDAKENLANAGSGQHDRLRCQSADFPARMADLFARRMGRQHRGWSLIHGSDDLDCAYRRVRIHSQYPPRSVQALHCPAPPVLADGSCPEPRATRCSPSGTQSKRGLPTSRWRE